jgi:hypothetical protein
VAASVRLSTLGADQPIPLRQILPAIAAMAGVEIDFMNAPGAPEAAYACPNIVEESGWHFPKG